MHLVYQGKFPEYKINFVHWDFANALRDVFIASVFTFMAILLYLLTRGRNEAHAIFSLMIGIFSCDVVEKYRHYKDLNYPVDKFTSDDWLIMGITILVTIYEYIYTIKKVKGA